MAPICQWRFVPHDLPPWNAIYQQARRWLQAGVFEDSAHDLRMIARLVDEREAQPSAIILDGRTLQSTPESGDRAGHDGAEKKKGSQGQAAVDTLGQLLALHVTPADDCGVVGIIDATGQVKKGTHTPGVQRQWCGAVGKPENCIVTVPLALRCGRYKTLVDGDLSLPQAWSADRERCRRAAATRASASTTWHGTVRPCTSSVIAPPATRGSGECPCSCSGVVLLTAA